MPRIITTVVLALIATLAITSSGSAFTAKTALRADRQFSQHRVGANPSYLCETLQQNSLGYGGFASDSPLASRGTAGAENAANAGRLARQLASEEQVAQLLAGEGRAILGAGTRKALTEASRLAREYGGKAADWAKVTSSNRFGFETHAYQNVVTGQVVEMKTKILWWWW